MGRRDISITRYALYQSVPPAVAGSSMQPPTWLPPTSVPSSLMPRRPGQIGENVSQGAAGRTVAATRMRAINTATGVSGFEFPLSLARGMFDGSRTCETTPAAPLVCSADTKM